ncbi:protein SLX4IP isoform X1 [Hemiscyllium ocellatum]|uniref:protein SLX4IP isoform X1 n=1 Tax=Hemiscyllium ocellatum TaxID=170820 RepID=UPI00296760EB|nr:protein SLX4IP isoform X1 [Hemiscyllium ocellatum]
MLSKICFSTMMPSNKFVLKCGNFAVLVDLHILPRGTSKDTSWFTEHHKEEVSALVKEDVDFRIKQYLEMRKQRGNVQSKLNKELTPSNPLCRKGQTFRLAAYFMKRHMNLRCVTQQNYCGLYIFPERFVVCITPCETGPKKGIAEEQITGIENGTSEYFTGGSEMKELCDVSISIQKKKEALKHIVEKSCHTKIRNFNKSEANTCLPKVLHTVTEDEQDVAQSATGFKHEIQDINIGRTEDCMNSVQSKLLLPVIKLEKYINKRQPAQENCQQQPRSIEQLKTGLKGTVGGNESALQDPKQSEVNTKIPMQRRKDSCSNEADSAKKIVLTETSANLCEITMEVNSLESLGKPPVRKKLLNHNSNRKRSVKGKPNRLEPSKEIGGEPLFSLGNSPQDFCFTDKHKKRRLTTRTKQIRKSENAPSSPSDWKSVKSAKGTASVEVESDVENVPRKSRLRRPKKTGTARN